MEAGAEGVAGDMAGPNQVQLSSLPLELFKSSIWPRLGPTTCANLRMTCKAMRAFVDSVPEHMEVSLGLGNWDEFEEVWEAREMAALRKQQREQAEAAAKSRGLKDPHHPLPAFGIIYLGPLAGSVGPSPQEASALVAAQQPHACKGPGPVAALLRLLRSARRVRALTVRLRQDCLHVTAFMLVRLLRELGVATSHRLTELRITGEPLRWLTWRPEVLQTLGAACPHLERLHLELEMIGPYAKGFYVSGEQADWVAAYTALPPSLRDISIDCSLGLAQVLLGPEHLTYLTHLRSAATQVNAQSKSTSAGLTGLRLGGCSVHVPHGPTLRVLAGAGVVRPGVLQSLDVNVDASNLPDLLSLLQGSPAPASSTPAAAGSSGGAGLGLGLRHLTLRQAVSAPGVHALLLAAPNLTSVRLVSGHVVSGSAEAAAETRDCLAALCGLQHLRELAMHGQLLAEGVGALQAEGKLGPKVGPPPLPAAASAGAPGQDPSVAVGSGEHAGGAAQQGLQQLSNLTLLGSVPPGLFTRLLWGLPGAGLGPLIRPSCTITLPAGCSLSSIGGGPGAGAEWLKQDRLAMAQHAAYIDYCMGDLDCLGLMQACAQAAAEEAAQAKTGAKGGAAAAAAAAAAAGAGAVSAPVFPPSIPKLAHLGQCLVPLLIAPEEEGKGGGQAWDWGDAAATVPAAAAAAAAAAAPVPMDSSAPSAAAAAAAGGDGAPQGQDQAQAAGAKEEEGKKEAQQEEEEAPPLSPEAVRQLSALLPKLQGVVLQRACRPGVLWDCGLQARMSRLRVLALELDALQFRGVSMVGEVLELSDLLAASWLPRLRVAVLVLGTLPAKFGRGRWRVALEELVCAREPQEGEKKGEQAGTGAAAAVAPSGQEATAEAQGSGPQPMEVEGDGAAAAGEKAEGQAGEGQAGKVGRKIGPGQVGIPRRSNAADLTVCLRPLHGTSVLRCKRLVGLVRARITDKDAMQLLA